jgi:hypothetical protein
MACCGRRSTYPVQGKMITVEYQGRDPVYKVSGVMTGKIYRFRGNGFRQLMDQKDWHCMQDSMLKRIQ